MKKNIKTLQTLLRNALRAVEKDILLRDLVIFFLFLLRKPEIDKLPIKGSMLPVKCI